jgi:prenyltransferase/squalene oxidase-like repeat protein
MESKRSLQKLPAGNAHRVMGAGNIEEFNKLCLTLINTTLDLLNRNLPLRRIVLVASILRNCNVTLPFHKKLTNRILSEQKKDGGWIDCEDTAWCLGYLGDLEEFENEAVRGCSWLEKEQSKNKGWGFCARDNPCIPITAQIIYFLPQSPTFSEPSKWLEEQWRRDLKTAINLNYKGAWYLLAFSSLHESANLSFHVFRESVDYLIKEQRDNGSWGPWKNHPAPEECFITGISMAALALSYSISKDKKILPTLKKGLEWIREMQLKNGLFPTHYIEEGSAWIFFGWSKSMTVLREIEE